MIIFTILNVVLILLALVGFVLTLLTPVGIILLIIYLTKKKEQRSGKMLKWAIVLLCGIPLVAATFFLYGLTHLIATAIGVNPLVNPGGGLRTFPLLK